MVETLAAATTAVKTEAEEVAAEATVIKEVTHQPLHLLPNMGTLSRDQSDAELTNFTGSIYLAALSP